MVILGFRTQGSCLTDTGVVSLRLEASINFIITNQFANHKGEVQWTDLGIISIHIIIDIISFMMNCMRCVIIDI